MAKIKSSQCSSNMPSRVTLNKRRWIMNLRLFSDYFLSADLKWREPYVERFYLSTTGRVYGFIWPKKSGYRSRNQTKMVRTGNKSKKWFHWVETANFWKQILQKLARHHASLSSTLFCLFYQFERFYIFSWLSSKWLWQFFLTSLRE